MSIFRHRKLILFFILLTLLHDDVHSFIGTQRRGVHLRMAVTEESYTVKDLKTLSTKAALSAVCGDRNLLKGEYRYDDDQVSVVKGAPTVNRFVVANPKAMLENPLISKSMGLDFDTIDPKLPLSKLATELPVIYIADVHPEYGTMGFMLNKRSDVSMNDIHPEFRSFRSRAVYLGGTQNRGNSFTMLHKRQGFPDNRALKVLPDNDAQFRLYFSPDVAMANELCMTGDADHLDFKFFQWATIWLPKQIEMEYEQRCWLTLKAPVGAIFDDDIHTQPLWRRLIGSLPAELLQSR